VRRGVSLLVLAVVASVLGVASARADGTGTTTATTGTTTTTPPAPSYAPLRLSYLPTSCVGAGAAVIEEPGRQPLALGTPASSLGPSAYPAGTPIVAFGSLSASGTTCSNTSVTLSSVSLFGGAVTATSVSGLGGRGTVTGLVVEGAAVSLAPGQVASVAHWAQVTTERKVGRARGILVMTLVAPHGSLAAGTVIAVGFQAAPEPISKLKPAPQPTHPQADGQTPPTVNHGGSTAAASLTPAKKQQRLPRRPPPDYPTSPSPFTGTGGLPAEVRKNPVVATALQYLGVPYQWGGASPTTGFDCSGLVQYVFAQLHVPLVHFAAAQWHASDSVWVAPNHLQPGDLVFFIGSDGTRKEPGHVGIYVDDGYIIDAPHTGTLVRFDSLDEPSLADGYVGARRIDPDLIDARHLLHVTKTSSAETTLPLDFPAFPDEPLASAAPARAVAATASQGYAMWGGGGLGGLLLLAVAGLFVRRRRSGVQGG
jgi:cell wall-associated NlpC family hydrolase